MGPLTADPLCAPEPLGERHILSGFDCGEASLNHWLQLRALANQASGASRTYVVRQGATVMGYYALATAAVALDTAPGRFRRNMPDPIPAVLLARLAVDRRAQRAGVGRGMLRDAMARTAAASDQVGIALLLVHALNDAAKSWYLSFQFTVSPMDPTVVMARVRDIRANRLAE